MAKSTQYVARHTPRELPAPPLRRAGIDGKQLFRRPSSNGHPPPQGPKTTSALDPWQAIALEKDQANVGPFMITPVDGNFVSSRTMIETNVIVAQKRRCGQQKVPSLRLNERRRLSHSLRARQTPK